VLVATFALSWIFFEPNIVASLPLPITAPLAVLSLLVALAVKLTRKADDDRNAFRLVTVFLVIGATLYYFPLVFAVEAASQKHLAWFANNLTSNTNVSLALGIMWGSLAGALLIAGWLFLRAITSASRIMSRRAATPTPVPMREVASGAR
ncbi:MAG: hypothetical protein ABI068_00770, partial [Ktedonobacterales bacterium]